MILILKKIVIVVICVFIISCLGIYMVHLNKKNNNVANNSANTSHEENIIKDIKNVSFPENKVIEKPKVQKEADLANFSTDLQGDNARINNIKITCEAINENIINPGETFSFNEIVGMPSKDKGYQEADVIVDTHVEKGFGGGNCQVSTTLYNACLNIANIEIIERNPHKKKVYYIEEGKDASVSYSGGLDFKFKNNTEDSIKIYMNSEDNKVTAKIVKLYS